MEAIEFALFCAAFLPISVAAGYGLGWASRRCIENAGKAADRMLLGLNREDQP